MRAIKFRGKANGRWIYGGLVYSDNIEPAIYFEVGNKVCRMEWAYVDPATVGQFTGMLDKNGREIYEGDFINYDGSTWGGVVQWHPNGYFFINDSYGKKYPRCDSYRSLGDMLDGMPLVVIGNIHDNPDLIEKGGEQ